MRCILTENDQWGLVPTHIFPRALNGTDGEKTWSFLSMLFSPEKVSVWKRALCETQNGQTRINTERVENYISLHLGPHNLWNRLAFALHPIYLSADKTTLDLQLHCLPLKKNPPKSFRSEKIFTTRGPFFDLLPPDSEGYWPNPHVGFFNWDGQGQLLRTGDMITMTTSDPDNLPLPSWHLLEMQWVFARITAMCGASEPPNEAEC